jgi:hypothetical protein
VERPAQFAGKRQEDLTPEEFATLVKERNEAFVKGVEGTEFAGGLRPPAHHARHPGVDDAGRLGQLLPDRAVARQRGPYLRDDP